MKERWTLYETYTADENPEKEGEYKLYEVDGEGKLSDEPYEGTEEEAAENGIKLVKKAITLDASDSSTMEDLGWNKPEDIWIAYEENNSESSTEYEPAYPDIGTDESDYEIKKNIYVQVKTVGNVVQTGEGQIGMAEKWKPIIDAHRYEVSVLTVVGIERESESRSLKSC